MMVALLVAVGVVVGAALGWRIALARIPRHETDRLFRQFAARGMQPNVLSPGYVRNARRNDVPMDNPDTMTRAAMLDLSGGPLVFEARVPDGVEYWSVSVFAHNGDALFCLNDHDLGAGPFRLGLRQRGAPEPRDCRAQVSLPDPRGILIVRLVLPDRSDRALNRQLKSLIGDAAIVPAARD
jgi:uncharacterized membrane protein